MLQRYIKVSISENLNKEKLQTTCIFNILAYEKAGSTCFPALIHIDFV
jgi:hypothetical protein